MVFQHEKQFSSRNLSKTSRALGVAKKGAIIVPSQLCCWVTVIIDFKMQGLSFRSIFRRLFSDTDLEIFTQPVVMLKCSENYQQNLKTTTDFSQEIRPNFSQ